MTDTSERDRLAELLASFLHAPTSTPYFVAGYIAGPDEIADVLLAAGWSRVVPRPDVEAEIEWGVRYGDGGFVDYWGTNRESAEDRAEWLRGALLDVPIMLVSRRTVGPWQEAP